MALSLTASSLFANPAQAKQPAAPGATSRSHDEARADAEKRLQEGLDRYAKGDYEGARLAFAQAYAVLTSLDLLYNLMRSEVKSGHPLEALVHIHQMLRDPNATAEDRAKAQRLLEEANRVTGHIAVEAPSGAEIIVDDVPSGDAPIREPFDVPPGKHKVEARSGATRNRVDVEAPAGDIVTARFALDIHPPTVSAPVPIETTRQGSSIAAPAALPAPVAAEKPTPTTAPAPAEADHSTQPSSRGRIVVPVVIGAAAVVALGVGVGMGLVSQGKANDATNFRNSHTAGFCADRASALCSQYAGILDSQGQATTVSRAMFVTGGVLAAAAIITFVVWPRDRSEHGGRSAWVAPTLGGLRAGFSF